jgi:hypothetical protein
MRNPISTAKRDVRPDAQRRNLDHISFRFTHCDADPAGIRICRWGRWRASHPRANHRRINRWTASLERQLPSAPRTGIPCLSLPEQVEGREAETLEPPMPAMKTMTRRRGRLKRCSRRRISKATERRSTKTHPAPPRIKALSPPYSLGTPSVEWPSASLRQHSY